VSIITLIGIDPGFKNTGAVSLTLDPAAKSYDLVQEALPGNDLGAIRDFVDDNYNTRGDTKVFVESYRIRGRVSRMDSWMMQFLSDIRGSGIPGIQIIDNMGVKKVITKDLMEAFRLWKSPVASHHSDVRSAGYIALYGAVKDQWVNQNYLVPFLLSHINGASWPASA
jgi:hypothetical protein